MNWKFEFNFLKFMVILFLLYIGIGYGVGFLVSFLAQFTM